LDVERDGDAQKPDANFAFFSKSEKLAKKNNEQNAL
jgi:hypothetical protein